MAPASMTRALSPAVTTVTRDATARNCCRPGATLIGVPNLNTGRNPRPGGDPSYCSGENDAGSSIFESWVTSLAVVGGGQMSLSRASCRTRIRSSNVR